MIRISVFCLLTALLAVPVVACEFCDVVAEVVDGDTVIVVNNGQARTVHLVSVDAPQLEQPYGKQAKVFVEELLLNRVVIIDASDKAMAADVISYDGQSLKWALVRAGLAWYPQNHGKSTDRRVNDSLGKYERQARRKRVGLWADKSPQPPWMVHRGAETLPAVMASFGNQRLGAPCIIG